MALASTDSNARHRCVSDIDRHARLLCEQLVHVAQRSPADHRHAAVDDVRGKPGGVCSSTDFTMLTM